MNTLSYILLIVIAIAFLLALRSWKKQGFGCSGNCSGCSASCPHRKEP